MPMIRLVAAACCTALLFLAAGAQSLAQSQSAGGGQQVTTNPARQVPTTKVPLADDKLREAVERLQAGKGPPPGVRVVGDKVRVEIVHTLGANAIDRAVRDLGGSVYGEAESLTGALVPFRKLAALERQAGVTYLRLPLRVDEPVAGGSGSSAEQAATTGQEVTKTNAAAWQSAGYNGTGIKIGIVDAFDGAVWDAAVTAGELPTPAGTFCRASGVSCNIWAGNSRHGEGVGEIIHEMAPQAQVYLASTETATDLQATVDYFVSQGVKVITRSETAEYDGAGNGTGPIANVINNAVSHGITWFNSAGNNAGVTGVRSGSYWRGSWSSPDGDVWLDFTSGDELLDITCSFVNGLRWSDWGSNRTDYDAYIYDDAAATLQVASSEAAQGNGAEPIERLRANYSCTSGETDYLAVKLYAANGGTAGDVLEFMTNGTPVQGWSNPYSGTGPASDTASAGGLSIGAIDPWDMTTIAPYSAWGPTNDNRTKPDITAAACVASYSWTAGCFNGTSAATPVAAGAGALVLQSGLATTPAQLKTYLRTQAAVERGAPGTDNVYGAGELILPAPPTPPGAPTNVVATAGDASASLSWTAPSSVGGGGITNYVVTPYIGTVAQPTTTVGNVTSTTIAGLTNGTTYTFKVAARNPFGTGSQSAASNAVTPVSSGYPRPKGATPLRVPLVPGYVRCTSPTNANHGPPLAYASCKPPKPDSPALTVGTPDANGAAANSVGSLTFTMVGQPAAPEDSDVAVNLSLTDVRCNTGVTACGTTNSAAGADYTGDIYMLTSLRITDRSNAPSGSTTYQDSATGQDYQYFVIADCVQTGDTSIGGTCAVNTSFDALTPGAVLDAKRANIQINSISVADGGSDGVATTGPNNFFASPGIFVP